MDHSRWNCSETKFGLEISQFLNWNRWKRSFSYKIITFRDQNSEPRDRHHFPQKKTPERMNNRLHATNKNVKLWKIFYQFMLGQILVRHDLIFCSVTELLSRDTRTANTKIANTVQAVPFKSAKVTVRVQHMFGPLGSWIRVRVRIGFSKKKSSKYLAFGIWFFFIWFIKW